MLSSFERLGTPYPARLTFEVLARQFMKFIQERYPNADKVLQLAAALGISEELAAQIHHLHTNARCSQTHRSQTLQIRSAKTRSAHGIYRRS